MTLDLHLKAIRERAELAIAYNNYNELWLELPWLVDDKFSFEDILRLLAVVEKCREQRNTWMGEHEGHEQVEWQKTDDAELAAILEGRE